MNLLHFIEDNPDCDVTTLAREAVAHGLAWIVVYAELQHLLREKQVAECKGWGGTPGTYRPYDDARPPPARHYAPAHWPTRERVKYDPVRRGKK